jgi:cyclophilin family peptidyl-prolyl cis-trans isomerase
MPNPRREAKRERSQQAKKERERAARRQRMTKIVAVIAVLAIGFTGVGAWVSSGGAPEDPTINASDEGTTTAPIEPTTCPPADGSAERQIAFAGPPPECIDPEVTYTAVFDTSEGEVRAELDTERTPDTTNNFVVLARYGYYDGTEIFRTDSSIDIIQGGSPNTNDNTDPGPGYTIEDEDSGFSYSEGDLVMARTGAPNSAGGQYFFATGPAVSQLDGDGSYVTFGRTTEGLDVLKAIMAMGGEGNSAPSETVTVNSVIIEES